MSLCNVWRGSRAAKRARAARRLLPKFVSPSIGSICDDSNSINLSIPVSCALSLLLESFNGALRDNKNPFFFFITYCLSFFLPRPSQESFFSLSSPLLLHVLKL